MLWLAAALVFSPIQSSNPEILTEGLAISGVARSGRIPFPTDAIQELIAAGTWKTPKVGDEVTHPSGQKRAWTAFKANDKGEFDQRPMSSGYGFFTVHREKEEVAILEASGHGMVYVNGEPRAGDPYGFGYLKLPVLLKQGDNQLLFATGRGTFRASLVKPKNGAFLNWSDTTLPDLREGAEYAEQLAGIIVVNASNRTQRNLQIFAGPKGFVTTNAVPPIPPCSVLKVPVRFPGEARLRPTKGPVKLGLELRFVDRERSVLYDRAEVDLRVRKPLETYKRTFISSIDGSVQYYAVNPAFGLKPGEKGALVLSLHGAGVEAIGQADAYSSKSWCHIVCPTNRRPYGFDWEDWGRLDALEVLELAKTELNVDPSRVYLTGHSMGGHGAWNLAVLRPDLFAAVGPSAGWRSFFTYAGGGRPENPDPIESIFERSRLSSDTEAFVKNLAGMGVYVLHGDTDDNVPVSEARAMRDLLKPWHEAFSYYEKPGAGHWWDDSDEPGASCVDWAPMFDMFASRRSPEPWSQRASAFETPNPVVFAGKGFARVASQIEQGRLSSVNLRYDPHIVRFSGTTENVRLLFIDLPPVEDRSAEKVTFVLDGSSLEVAIPKDAYPWSHAVLENRADGWQIVEPVTTGLKWVGTAKIAEIGGPFKTAFRSNPIAVYGTTGTAAEDSWAFAKARYDSETFLYRGNGTIRLLSDKEFLEQSRKFTEPFPGCNIVIYGNADSNWAWNQVVGDSPLYLGRGAAYIDKRQFTGDATGSLFVVPSRQYAWSLVAAVGGTGLQGMRLTDRLPYFVSGVQYPDWCIFGPEVLSKGIGGVLGAGFFDNFWKYSEANSAWRKPSP